MQAYLWSEITRVFLIRENVRKLSNETIQYLEDTILKNYNGDSELFLEKRIKEYTGRGILVNFVRHSCPTMSIEERIRYLDNKKYSLKKKAQDMRDNQRKTMDVKERKSAWSTLLRLIRILPTFLAPDVVLSRLSNSWVSTMRSAAGKDLKLKNEVMDILLLIFPEKVEEMKNQIEHLLKLHNEARPDDVWDFEQLLRVHDGDLGLILQRLKEEHDDLEQLEKDMPKWGEADKEAYLKDLENHNDLNKEKFEPSKAYVTRLKNKLESLKSDPTYKRLIASGKYIPPESEYYLFPRSWWLCDSWWKENWTVSELAKKLSPAELKLVNKEGSLPKYWELCKAECSAIGINAGDGVKRYFLFLFLSVVPLLHLFTPIGLWTWYLVFVKYMLFLLTALGVWTPWGMEAYHVEEDVDEFAKRVSKNNKADENKRFISDTNEKYSAFLAATISPRSILLQLVPHASILSIYAAATSACPIFFSERMGENFNKYFCKQLYPLLAWKAFERAKQSEDLRHKKHKWILRLRAAHVFVTESRLISWLYNVYKAGLSISILYLPTSSALIQSAILLLLPYCYIRSLTAVVYLGKCMAISDGHFLLGLCGNGTSYEEELHDVKILKDFGLKEQEVGETLVEKMFAEEEADEEGGSQSLFKKVEECLKLMRETLKMKSDEINDITKKYLEAWKSPEEAVAVLMQDMQAKAKDLADQLAASRTRRRSVRNTFGEVLSWARGAAKQQQGRGAVELRDFYPHPGDGAVVDGPMHASPSLSRPSMPQFPNDNHPHYHDSIPTSRDSIPMAQDWNPGTSSSSHTRPSFATRDSLVAPDHSEVHRALFHNKRFQLSAHSEHQQHHQHQHQHQHQPATLHQGSLLQSTARLPVGVETRPQVRLPVGVGTRPLVHAPGAAPPRRLLRFAPATSQQKK
jgi:hypothetical protein